MKTIHGQINDVKKTRGIRDRDPDTGLYNFRFRNYSPALGRFVQVDPIRTRGGMNLYTFAHNEPTNRRDPLGLEDDTLGEGADPCAGDNSSPEDNPSTPPETPADPDPKGQEDPSPEVAPDNESPDKNDDNEPTPDKPLDPDLLKRVEDTMGSRSDDDWAKNFAERLEKYTDEFKDFGKFKIDDNSSVNADLFEKSLALDIDFNLDNGWKVGVEIGGSEDEFHANLKFTYDGDGWGSSKGGGIISIIRKVIGE